MRNVRQDKKCQISGSWVMVPTRLARRLLRAASKSTAEDDGQLVEIPR